MEWFGHVWRYHKNSTNWSHTDENINGRSRTKWKYGEKNDIKMLRINVSIDQAFNRERYRELLVAALGLIKTVNLREKI